MALSDVDAVGLEETKASIEGVRVTTATVDVSDRAALYQWAEHVEAEHGAAHIIINNAGVALAGSVRKVSDEDFEWLMNINFWGVVHGTRAFLPILERQPQGHIVNISSIFGIVAAPLNGTYNAAKFAVRGFTEALRMELQLDGLPIGVTSVHPGGIKTNIIHGCRHTEDDVDVTREELTEEFLKRARTTPETCAAQIVDGIRSNAARVLVGADAKFVDLVQRISPTGYQRLMKHGARRHWKRRRDDS